MTNDRIVILTLSASYLIIVVTLCAGLFIDKVDNKQIFGILQIFFNSGLLVYLGVIKNGKDKSGLLAQAPQRALALVFCVLAALAMPGGSARASVGVGAVFHQRELCSGRDWIWPRIPERVIGSLCPSKCFIPNSPIPDQSKGGMRCAHRLHFASSQNPLQISRKCGEAIGADGGRAVFLPLILCRVDQCSLWKAAVRVYLCENDFGEVLYVIGGGLSQVSNQRIELRAPTESLRNTENPRRGGAIHHADFIKEDIGSRLSAGSISLIPSQIPKTERDKSQKECCKARKRIAVPIGEKALTIKESAARNRDEIVCVVGIFVLFFCGVAGAAVLIGRG